MKIVIVGHLHGIGKTLYEEFSKQNHQVIGLDKSERHDISTIQGIDNVVADSIYLDSDMMILSAFDMTVTDTPMIFAQSTLLWKMYNAWENLDKKIVVLNSVTSDCSNNYPFIDTYMLSKKTLDSTVKQCRDLNRVMPHIINLKPGYVETKFIKNSKNLPVMSTMDLFNVLNFILMSDVMIFDISFSAKPPLKNQ